MLAAFFRNLGRDLVRQPLRTVLTLSGVVWGTFSVVLLVAFGESVGKAQTKRFHGMGHSIVLLFPSRTTLPWQGLQKGKAVRITPEQVEDLPDKVPGIELISPEFVQGRRIRFERQEFLSTIRGVNPSFELMRNTIAARGRFLNATDMEERRRVCMIGDVLASDLFSDGDPLARQILIEGVPFTVVGVMAKKLQGSNYNGNRDERCAFIPWTTFSALYGQKYISNIIFRPLEPARSQAVMGDIKRHFAKLVGFDPADTDAIADWDTLEAQRMFTTFFLAFNVFLGVLGAFTLLVGGVGVASIMMVVVEERTREIGVKLAVGARRRTILLQFFGESLAIMLLGGFVGFALSTFVIRAVETVNLPAVTDFVGTPALSPPVVVSTILILLAIGTVSGLIPARRAASTNPIAALRK
ncbi:MAG: ABC transporter permease [Candidatus Aminicenantes bacterium]|nr:ABC transporter permease [Candidatus Aminicenantes bacterium]